MRHKLLVKEKNYGFFSLFTFFLLLVCLGCESKWLVCVSCSLLLLAYHLRTRSHQSGAFGCWRSGVARVCVGHLQVSCIIHDEFDSEPSMLVSILHHYRLAIEHCRSFSRVVCRLHCSLLLLTSLPLLFVLPLPFAQFTQALKYISIYIWPYFVPWPGESEEHYNPDNQWAVVEH